MHNNVLRNYLWLGKILKSLEKGTTIFSREPDDIWFWTKTIGIWLIVINLELFFPAIS